MKFNHLIVLLLFFAIVSCKNDSDSVFVNTPDGEKVTYSFNVRELVSFDEQPIGGRRAPDDEPTYYLLEIDDITNTTVTYASGIFDHLPTSIGVDLFVGRDYRVNVKALRAGETFGIAVVQDSLLRVASSSDVITNRIVYGQGLRASFSTNNDTYYYNTADSSSVVETQESRGGFGGGPRPTFLDTYLGRADILQVLPIDSTIYFYLARNVFAFETNVNNLTSGALIVNVSGVSNQFDVSTSMEWGHTLSYGFLSSDSSLYDVNMNVNIRKYDTVASVVESELIFNQTVPFKRLHRKFINITLPEDTTVADTSSFSNFIITLEDQPIVDGDTLVIE